LFEVILGSLKVPAPEGAEGQRNNLFRYLLAKGIKNTLNGLDINVDAEPEIAGIVEIYIVSLDIESVHFFITSVEIDWLCEVNYAVFVGEVIVLNQLLDFSYNVLIILSVHNCSVLELIIILFAIQRYKEIIKYASFCGESFIK
jgi:hypothetical protein